MASQAVLKKILQRSAASEAVKQHFSEVAPAKTKKISRRPGRPAKENIKKARNFTLCLAPEFIKFLDNMIVKSDKIQGRGRKIRFIIERFIEHEKRSLGQMRFLREALREVQVELGRFESRVKQGEKLELSTKEKAVISKAVDQVMLLLKILNYAPKTLERILPREDWALLSFCLTWKTNNKRVIL